PNPSLSGAQPFTGSLTLIPPPLLRTLIGTAVTIYPPRAPETDSARIALALDGKIGGTDTVILSLACQNSVPTAHESENFMRRKRFQRGSLRQRKHGRVRVWVAQWWENGSRRSKVLDKCAQV